MFAQILLRLEKYPARLDFAKGTLETRRQTYRHLKLLLKPIPLETPTVIELSPSEEIKVTLFDANHCIGAVMFLIEGGGNAILYTGDIRAESWWVSSLTRNPTLIPFACGLKKLDNIYLDTTFATKAQPYREFPSKSAGIGELLEKMQQYPKDTIFYFISWTFGYEEVWMALSSFLESRIHLDDYKYNLYNSIQPAHSNESAQLGGYMAGNHFQRGCITKDENVRIHTCERGFQCSSVFKKDRVVTIIPVITRDHQGNEIRELGAGGGKGDLNQAQALEMQDEIVLQNLIALCSSNVEDAGTLERIKMLITSSHLSRNAHVQLESFIDPDETQETDETDTSLNRVVDQLSKMVQEPKDTPEASNQEPTDDLPRTITFPYSRHSSYSELCQLVAAFRPRSVYPCTVDETRWTIAVGMDNLFAEYCARGAMFDHDEEMSEKHQDESQQRIHASLAVRSQTTEAVSSPAEISQEPDDGLIKAASQAPLPLPTISQDTHEKVESGSHPQTVNGMDKAERSERGGASMTKRIAMDEEPRPTVKRGKNIQQWAYGAATGLDPECPTWEEFGGLICARKADASFEFGSNVNFTEDLSQDI
jgi:DNA cross-link repair 1C protein